MGEVGGMGGVGRFGLWLGRIASLNTVAASSMSIPVVRKQMSLF